MSRSPSPLDIAYGLLEEGRLIDAEQLLVRELGKAERGYGHGSPQWASAQGDLGNLLFSSGQVDRAVDCYRSACSYPPAGDREAYKDHLTYRLNLGTVLTMAGRLDEAEDELRRNVQERRDFYGREHPGYAYALEPLADVLLRRGDVGQARQIVEEAVGTFWRSGHERVATALALRAEIIVVSGGGEPAFADLEHLPDGIVEQIALTVMNRAGQDPSTGKAVLTSLVAALEERLGPDHQATLNALSQLANTGHDIGDEAGRVWAIEKVLASYDRQGRAEDALMATLGLAMAHEDAGDTAAALRTFENAWARADRIGRHELRAQVLRNWGLALSASGRTDEAERRLRDAVAEADRGHDHEMLGRSRIALGLFLQHEERLAEARQVVEAGLATLDVAHPDAITGRSHLGAIVQGRACGCGDVQGTIAEAFREFVITRLPADLLEDLDVTVEDGEFAIQVRLRRKPDPAEIEHMNRLIESANAEFRGRLTSRR
ncbi:tetratricopeptide repeat protein [Microbispora sp. SCL1-1]|jgi:tetratricopeptide (TPR) repeat protein|uniref:tetratricopeptide repeat protein n=1 Tax=Microbispora TaxID=2005 RepID=UPI00115BED9C|nr:MULTISPECIES: tetratricopeptide repeat protein [unclassified Microbispora]NJP28209.1 tetratricopeptide repeat protein [Microbispora sp. CL1-1]TQS09224.1 tetratricopeptide repeat protein [Microbispora sp. SCL1-1]